jgi:hypothetical protein
MMDLATYSSTRSVMAQDDSYKDIFLNLPYSYICRYNKISHITKISDPYLNGSHHIKLQKKHLLIKNDDEQIHFWSIQPLCHQFLRDRMTTHKWIHVVWFAENVTFNLNIHH